MPEVLSELLIRQVGSSAELYYRLIVVVASTGVANDSLQKIAARTGYRYINVNLELSQRLLELTATTSFTGASITWGNYWEH